MSDQPYRRASAHTDPQPNPSQPAGPGPQRDRRGRFIGGNRGGPGNPFARQVAAMRRAFANAVSEEDMAEIAQAQVQKAKEGDPVAARFVAEYVIGKPVPMADPDRVDLDELRQFQEEAALNKVVEECARGAPAALLCPLVQVLRDHVLPEWLQRFVLHMTQLFQAARLWAADGPEDEREAQAILTEMLAAVAERFGAQPEAPAPCAVPSPDGDNGTSAAPEMTSEAPPTQNRVGPAPAPGSARPATAARPAQPPSPPSASTRHRVSPAQGAPLTPDRHRHQTGQTDVPPQRPSSPPDDVASAGQS